MAKDKQQDKPTNPVREAEQVRKDKIGDEPGAVRLDVDLATGEAEAVTVDRAGKESGRSKLDSKVAGLSDDADGNPEVIKQTEARDKVLRGDRDVASTTTTGNVGRTADAPKAADAPKPSGGLLGGKGDAK
jgi:hypothetical protein